MRPERRGRTGLDTAKAGHVFAKWVGGREVYIFSLDLRIIIIFK
jgi:hypothetical protein